MEVMGVMALGVVLMMMNGDGRFEAMTSCNMDAAQLGECLPAIRGPSSTPPTKGCCDVIETANPQCLLGYKNSMLLLLSFGVDPKFAVALPKKCLLDTECNEKISAVIEVLFSGLECGVLVRFTYLYPAVN